MEGVEIVRLNTSRPGAVQVLEKLSPDIIVFDLTPSQLNIVFSFLRTHLDVVLIGLDLGRDRALFVAGDWRTLPTVEGLMQTIHAQIRAKSSDQP